MSVCRLHSPCRTLRTPSSKEQGCNSHGTLRESHNCCVVSVCLTIGPPGASSELWLDWIQSIRFAMRTTRQPESKPNCLSNVYRTDPVRDLNLATSKRPRMERLLFIQKKSRTLCLSGARAAAAVRCHVAMHRSGDKTPCPGY